MKVWKIAVVTALFGLFMVIAYQLFEIKRPLTAAELDGLAAITAGQRDCNWPYEPTSKGEWLRLRSVTEREVDATFQAKFEAAMNKYHGLTPEQQCALLDRLPDLIRRVQQ